MIDVEAIRQRFSAVAPFLDERSRRVVAAAEAVAAGYGGIAAVSMATGIAASTIGRGLQELSGPQEPGRIGRSDCARRPAIATALDVQERAPAGAGTSGARAPGRPHAGQRTA